MVKRNKWIGGPGLILASLILVLSLVYPDWKLPELAVPKLRLATEKGGGGKVLIKRVIDGDTIEIENGQRIRYIGINAPETVNPDKKIGCFGREASSKNRELVEGRLVRLEKDVSEADKYNRLLRYVWLDELLINEHLVKEGYAQVSTYPPDVKYQERFLAAQREAQRNNRGLWRACRE